MMMMMGTMTMIALLIVMRNNSVLIARYNGIFNYFSYGQERLCFLSHCICRLDTDLLFFK